MLNTRGIRVQPHIRLPHDTYLKKRLTSCPSCSGGRVHLEQLAFLLGRWTCEDCGSHRLFSLIFPDDTHAPTYMTPLEVEKKYPTVKHNENPRDYMFMKAHKTDGKISIYYGGD